MKMTLIIIIIILFFNLFIYVQHFTHNVTLNIKREKRKSLLFKQNKLMKISCTGQIVASNTVLFVHRMKSKSVNYIYK